MPLDQQLLTYLEKIGTPVRSFNQGSAWKKSATAAVRSQYPAEGDDSPSSGYCRGACLHWLRRVLIKKGCCPHRSAAAPIFPPRRRITQRLTNKDKKDARQKHAAAEIQYQRSFRLSSDIKPGEDNHRRVERMAAAWARPYAAEKRCGQPTT